MASRIARRIPVAKTIARADNPPAYVNAVAAAVETLGHPVEIAHGDWEGTGDHYHGVIELEQGLDLLWTNAPRNHGWHLATPSRDNRWRIDQAEPLYPDPHTVADAAHRLLAGELAAYGMTVTT